MHHTEHSWLYAYSHTFLHGEDAVNRSDSDRVAPSASMAPQITAAFFALVLGLMLLLPFVRLSLEGADNGELLIHLAKTDFGINVFALILLLSPLAGIIVAMTMRGAWAIASAIVAAIGVIMVPLAIFTLQAEASSAPRTMAHVSPGVGTFAFPIALGIIAVVSALRALRERRRDRSVAHVDERPEGGLRA